MKALTDAEASRIKRLAGRAEALLADADFRDMIGDLKHGAIRDWAAADTTEKREACWHRLQAIGELETLMGAYRSRWELEERKRRG